MHADLAAAARTLSEALSLRQPPIAIALTDAPLAGVATWTESVPAGCRFWQEATTQVFATQASDHALCAIGMYTHNLPRTTAQGEDLQLALKVFADLGYVRADDLPLIPVAERRASTVVYGPLAEFPVTPDVVMLFVRADQSLILAEAIQQVEHGLPPTMGRPACAVVSQAINSSRAAVSLGCCGARAYLDIMTDDVSLYALPGSQLAGYVERVAALAQANQILTRFHHLRRLDVAAGQRPSVADSLARLSADGAGGD